MDLRKNKTNTSYLLFLKQLLVLAASILCEIIFFMLFLGIGIYQGFIIPANYVSIICNKIQIK